MVDNETGKESLPKGRISTVDLLVLTSLNKATFDNAIVLLFCITSCLNEEANCTELSLSVRVPCFC
jgi:hypothetical protein